VLGGSGATPLSGRQRPPALAPAPPGLAPEQLKRRHIVASLVHSENNYVSSLQRLVHVSRLNLMAHAKTLTDLDAGLQKTLGRKQPAHSEPHQSSASFPPGAGNFGMPRALQVYFFKDSTHGTQSEQKIGKNLFKTREKPL